MNKISKLGNYDTINNNFCRQTNQCTLYIIKKISMIKMELQMKK